MKKTQELIGKIKEALNNGKMQCGEIPVTDIAKCVEKELNIYENTFTATQFAEIKSRFSDFCSYIRDGETDPIKVKMFIDGMLLCLQTISDVVCSLASREYWSKWHREHLDDPEVEEIISFVDRRKDIRLLPYDFVDDYMALPCEVGFDADCNMHYIPYKGRRMYFPEGWEAQQSADYYRALIAEQDERSPHCYRKAGYEMPGGAVIADVGAAEGFFSLDHIDEAKHIYILDADQKWIGALKRTFQNDMDKVDIIYGYVGAENDGEEHISLDSVIGEGHIDYIKMDIEGYEKDALTGAAGILDRNDVICAICTYHCKEDEEWVTRFFESKGYQTDHSRGFMCPDWTVRGRLEAELRRGVVFGRKTS